MAKKIFEVEISNRGPRGYETAALLKMPATWGEFNDALQKARIEDGRCCQNELTRIEYPGIQREMIGDNVDLYELNLLAQRLSELSKDDQMGMDGLLQIEKIHSTGPISLPRLINLTFNADICLLAPQVSNTQELGGLLCMRVRCCRMRPGAAGYDGAGQSVSKRTAGSVRPETPGGL